MSWDPFRELRRMRDQLEQMFNNLEGRELPGIGERKPEEAGRKTPFTDIQERDGEITVTADLPGVKKEDIKVSVEDNYLIISADRSSEESEEGEGYVRKERKFGRFYRKIRLPSDVKKEEAKATYNNGVLEIKLPKKEKEKQEGKNIEIE